MADFQDVLKNRPTAPASFSGVIHQARNMAGGAPSIGTGPTVPNTGVSEHSIKAKQHLAQLEDNILRRKVGDSYQQMGLSAAKAADSTDLSRQQLDLQKPDTFDKIAYGIAGVAGLSHAAYATFRSLGWEGGANIMGKLPWLAGVAKQDKLADEAADMYDEATEKQDATRLAALDAATTNMVMVGDLHRTMRHLLEDWGLSKEDIEKRMKPNYEAYNRYLSFIEGYGAITSGEGD